jgi:MoaA/NifB/PqqE/SkfB family radical SAM enzyme
MKLINTAVGIVKSRLGRSPFYARFHVTHRCNYDCRMCGFHRLGDQSKELAGEQVHVVAERLAQLGARHLVITGGEPFLRPDLPEVIAAFAARKFSIRVQTNGGSQVTRSLLSACVDAGLQDLSVSIDTLDRLLQDDICRTSGTVDHALRTLRLAAELLPGSISLANVVASGYNFEQLPALVEFFHHEMGAYTCITPVMISADSDGDFGDYRCRGGDHSFRFDSVKPEVRERVMSRLIELRRKGLGLTNSKRYLKDFGRYLASGVCEWHCDSRNLCLEVYPDGAVSFCKEKPPTDNILDDGFIARYRSGEFHRRTAAQAESCTGCFYAEYREPYYAVHDFSVLCEWTWQWLLTLRRGMRSKR